MSLTVFLRSTGAVPSRHKLGQHLIHEQFMRLGGDRDNDRIGETHLLNTGVDIPFDPWGT